MRIRFLALLLLPAICFGQNTFYFSADGSANFGKHLEWTGYSANVSGNVRLSDKLYAGIATGVLQVKPFINHLSVPLSARITFFTSSDEAKIAPFGLFEFGKLFYRENGYAGIPTYTMEGKTSFFTGVGIRLPSQSRTHSFLAIGYAGYHYANNQHDHQNRLIYSKPYHYRRMAIKVGVMLPRNLARRLY